MSAVEMVAATRCEVGEGPLWDEAAGVLWWVDITHPAILRFDPRDARVDRWIMPERVGFLVQRRDAPGFVAGFKSGLQTVEIVGERVSRTLLAAFEPAGVDDRINDGCCDREGRLWFGTMDDREIEPTGYLHRYVAGGVPTRCDGPYVVTNGPAVSAAGDVLYHVDSVGRAIWRFAVDPDGGLADRILFVRFEADDWGVPDGAACDADDHVWVAHWGGARVTRFTPSGEIERAIDLPTPQITKVAFGGPDLRTLYITSAAIGRPAADAPAGALFRVETDVRGIPARRFAG